ncbi:MAG: hypothetical protein AAB706_01000 [Patescibacteria group bacterium]
MKKNIQTKIISTLTILVIIALGFWILQSKPWGRERNQSVSLQELSFDLTAKSNTNDAVTPSLDANALMKETAVYSDPSGFSFRYPKSFHTSTFSEGEGEIILVQTPSAEVGFQIFVAPFDEEGSALTAERIKKDIPDIFIQDPQPVTVTGGGKGITFISDSDNIKTREVWFVTKGYLYQITTNLNSESLLVDVLKTFTF